MLINNVELVEQDDMVVRAAHKNNGQFEPETFAFLDTLPAHGTFVDVGAYTGIYGIWAAKKKYNAMFFEPNPIIFTRLLTNIHRNNITGQCYNVALTEKKGTITFNMSPDTVMTSAGSLMESPKKTRQIDVSGYPYSEYSLGGESVIKIDVEGAELQVLKGMRTVLEIEKPLLIVEVLNRGQENEVIAYTKQFGYNVEGMFDDRNLILY